jgi:ankyrin repeat protein
VPIRRLPSEPSLEHLRNEAKQLQQRYAARDAEAAALIREFHPRSVELVDLKRADAQLVVARSYGFPSWPRLHRYIDAVRRYRQPNDLASVRAESLADRFLRLACLTYSADGPERRQEARELLAAHPELARTSIHTMAAVGDVAAAAELLAADLSQVRRRGAPHGWEPLLYVAYSRLDSPRPEHSTLEVARLLLEHGADPNAGFLGSWGPPPFTVLTGAFGYGEDAPNQPPHEYELDLARLLLDHGADPNDAQTLYNNMWRRTSEHLELLFAYGLGTGDGGPWYHRLAPLQPTPQELLEEELRFAAEAGRLDRVELLIRHGVDVNGLGMRHPTLHDRNALELALANAHLEVADLLVEAGATAAAQDPAERLLAACMAGDRQRVRELLAADEHLAAEAVGRDPRRLINAVELDRPDAVRLLVDIGFDVNEKMRTTALHLAAYDGNQDMVELLLELGANPLVRDDDFNATASGWARHAHHHALADELAARETDEAEPEASADND